MCGENILSDALSKSGGIRGGEAQFPLEESRPRLGGGLESTVSVQSGPRTVQALIQSGKPSGCGVQKAEAP